MSNRPCNNPGIIGNKLGFIVLFCDLPEGHKLDTGGWCQMREGKHGGPTINWRCNGTARSLAPTEPRTNTCKASIDVRGYRLTRHNLIPASKGSLPSYELNSDPLLFVCHGDESSEGFSYVHIGHECQGDYEPLGIEWKIRW